MKYILFILLGCTTIVNAQGPAAGSRWTYYLSDLAGVTGKPYTLDVVKDTVVNGKLLKRFNGGVVNGCAAQPYSPFVLYENRKVFQYDSTRKQFFLLYDWNKGIGDTVTSYVALPVAIDSFKYVIDSVIYWTPNGEFLKVQVIHYLKPGLDHYGFASYNLIEKLGANAYFFPQYLGCTPVQWGSIRCFEEPGQISVKFVPYKCDSTVRTGTPDYLDDKNVRIYPTLVSNTLRLENTGDQYHEKYFIYVTDALGRTVDKEVWNEQESSKTLDTGNWRTGIYFVTLQNASGARSTKKIIKIE